MIGLLKHAAMSAAAAVMAVCVMAAPAGAVVVNFDDLPTDGLVPDGYGGINWNGEWSYYDDFQETHYLPHSGATRAYPTSNDPSAGFDFLVDVVFDGVWMNGHDQAGSIFLELFLDGLLVHSTSGLLLGNLGEDNTTFLASGYAGLVDRVVVHSDLNYWIMDDVTYSVAAVPEPGSMALLGGGLLGAVLLRRRRARP